MLLRPYSQMKLEQFSDPKNIFFCHALLFFFATTSVLGGDSPPTLDNDVEDGILSVAVSEGTLAVVTLSAKDLDGDSVTFDLSQDENEVEDADLFDLNTSTGTLTFINAPSYDDPKDSDEDNVYVLLISYTDGFTPDESVEVRVTVTTTFVYLTVQTQGLGSVPGADAVTNYQQGDTVSLTAEPEPGNEFIQWTGDTGDVPANDNPLSLMMDLNKSVTAVFAKLNAVPFFTNISPGEVLEISVNENQAEVLTLSADDDDNDSVTFALSGTDAGLFDLNTTTGVLTFLNSPDYESPADGDFDNIYELEVSVSDAQDTSPSSPLRITIQDQSEDFTLTVVVEGEGTVTSDGVSVSSSHTFTHSIDANVSLVTVPELTSVFSHWTGDVNGSENTTTVNIDAHKTVTAVFVKLNAVPYLTNTLSDGNLSIEMYENQTEVLTLTANDDDDDPLAFSLSGTDDGLFDLNATTGVLSFKVVPDYENPSDVNLDNTYELSIQVSDGNATSLPTTMKVFVTNLTENEWIYADDKGSGWRAFSWFGNYCETSAGWIYHEDHGWLYRTGDTTTSIWFYDPDPALGWLWTNVDAYPYFYRNDNISWLYYEPASKGPRKFYDYATKSWVEVF